MRFTAISAITTFPVQFQIGGNSAVHRWDAPRKPVSAQSPPDSHIALTVSGPLRFAAMPEAALVAAAPAGIAHKHEHENAAEPARS